MKDSTKLVSIEIEFSFFDNKPYQIINKDIIQLEKLQLEPDFYLKNVNLTEQKIISLELRNSKEDLKLIYLKSFQQFEEFFDSGKIIFKFFLIFIFEDFETLLKI